MNWTTFQQGEVKVVSLGIAVVSALIAYAAVSVPHAYAYPYWAPYSPQVQFFAPPTPVSYFGYSNYGNAYSSSGSSVWAQPAGAPGSAGGAGGSIFAGGGNGANGGAVGGQGGSGGGGVYISNRYNINSSSIRVR